MNIRATSQEATTLNGSFVWEHGNTSGDLEAVFTPTGDDNVMETGTLTLR